MKKLNLQFHIMPEEIVLIISSISADGFLYVTDLGSVELFQVKPYSGIEHTMRIGRNYVFIAISERKPKITCSSQREYNEMNPGTLYLVLGNISGNILNESSLSGFLSAEDRTLMSFYTIFKKKLNRGCTVQNIDSGIQRTSKDRYYSKGAADFYHAGGILKGLGNNIVLIV